jgi:hypothetical protein
MENLCMSSSFKKQGKLMDNLNLSLQNSHLPQIRIHRVSRNKYHNISILVDKFDNPLNATQAALSTAKEKG